MFAHIGDWSKASSGPALTTVRHLSGLERVAMVTFRGMVVRLLRFLHFKVRESKSTQSLSTRIYKYYGIPGWHSVSAPRALSHCDATKSANGISGGFKPELKGEMQLCDTRATRFSGDISCMTPPCHVDEMAANPPYPSLDSSSFSYPDGTALYSPIFSSNRPRSRVFLSRVSSPPHV